MEYKEIDVVKEDKWVKHIHEEGSLYHVVYYDTSGMHCSTVDCEINKPDKEKTCK